MTTNWQVNKDDAIPPEIVQWSKELLVYFIHLGNSEFQSAKGTRTMRKGIHTHAHTCPIWRLSVHWAFQFKLKRLILLFFFPINIILETVLWCFQTSFKKLMSIKHLWISIDRQIHIERDRDRKWEKNKDE